MGTDVRLGAMDGVFTVAGVRPARDGMTISRDAGLGSENTVTFLRLAQELQ